MRLRNIKGAEEFIASSEFVMQTPEEYKGKWNTFFGNDNPIHIEIGMGKGKFIHAMAEQTPGINYIGIEMYSSVLYRAIEKDSRQNVPICILSEWTQKILQKFLIKQRLTAFI